MADGVFFLSMPPKGHAPNALRLKKAFQTSCADRGHQQDRSPDSASPVLDEVFDLSSSLAQMTRRSFPRPLRLRRAVLLLSLEEKGKDIVPVFEALLSTSAPHGDADKSLQSKSTRSSTTLLGASASVDL